MVLNRPVSPHARVERLVELLPRIAALSSPALDLIFEPQPILVGVSAGLLCDPPELRSCPGFAVAAPRRKSAVSRNSSCATEKMLLPLKVGFNVPWLLLK